MGKRTETRGSSRAIPSEGENKIRQRIAERAYQLFQERGQVNGHDIDDWLQAERQIQAEQVKPIITPARAGRRKEQTSRVQERLEAPQ
ncbi:MAG TPA: DUF2934 domain-containing protein [Nitrospiria bacterium]|nr:DUF2934 domain-containing protein [Nitrospiria bacterium]